MYQRLAVKTNNPEAIRQLVRSALQGTRLPNHHKPARIRKSYRSASRMTASTMAGKYSNPEG